MTPGQMDVLYELLERIAKALEKGNEMHEPPQDFEELIENQRRTLDFQERDLALRERNAAAWEEHNLWHRQLGTMTEDHPKAH